MLDMHALHRNEITHEVEGEDCEDQQQPQGKKNMKQHSPVPDDSPKRQLLLDSSPEGSPKKRL